MKNPSLNLESLESRTLLAALLEGESFDTDAADAQETADFDTEAILAATDQAETSEGEQHHKHGVKHKLSKAASKVKGELEDTADAVKHEAMRTLDKVLEKTGDAIRSSETATAVVGEAIKVTDKVLTKLT